MERVRVVQKAIGAEIGMRRVAEMEAWVLRFWEGVRQTDPGMGNTYDLARYKKKKQAALPRVSLTTDQGRNFLLAIDTSLARSDAFNHTTLTLPVIARGAKQSSPSVIERLVDDHGGAESLRRFAPGNDEIRAWTCSRDCPVADFVRA